MANSSPPRILFVTSSRIGDAVLSSGVLAGLLAAYPDALFTVASGPAAAKLFADFPRLERLHVMTRRPRGGHWWDLWRRSIGTRWLTVADLRGSLLAWTLFARYRLVCAAEWKHEHRVEEIRRVLHLPRAPAPQLWVAEERQRRVDALLGEGAPILAVGPTANWRPKQWPAARFAEALARMVAKDGGILPGARIAVLGAPWERGMAQPLFQAHPGAIDLMGLDDPLDGFAALRRAAFYLGNDSGLMHMAAAAGVPTLGLFGPSAEWRYGPYGETTAIARTTESFEELVSENPAFDHRREDCLMTSLSVEAVVTAARDLWRKVPAASPQEGGGNG